MTLIALLQGIAVILGGMAALILVVLATPVRLSFEAQSAPSARLRILARIIAGVSPRLPVFDTAWFHNSHNDASAAADSNAEKSKGSSKRTKKNRDRKSGRRIRSVVDATPSFVRDLTNQVRFEHLNIDADLGLGDPAATGEAWGWLSPVLYALPPNEKIRVCLRPDFANARLDGEATARLRVTPLALAPTALRFGWRVFGPGQ
ncbi:MAG: hypothetical protein AAFQ67_02965 [Pseudomonadota bacterium]